MTNIERVPHPQSKLEQKEGRFHGGIKFSPKELLGEGDLNCPEGMRLLTSLVIDGEGAPKIKKGIYNSKTVPEKIDPADFDYDDDAMAEYYDPNPNISIIDIDVSKADELLVRRQRELEKDLAEIDAETEKIEDEMEGEQVEMARSPIEDDLEQVKALRAKLLKTK